MWSGVALRASQAENVTFSLRLARASLPVDFRFSAPSMAHHRYSRPASATAAAYLLLAACLFYFLRGVLFLNDQLHDQGLRYVWVYLFVPPFIGVISAFLFLGHNWARIVYWILLLPICVCMLVIWPANFSQSTIYLLAAIMLLCGGLLAHPNAHWYFTNRDFRRRPGFRAHFDRQENAGDRDRRKKFEY